MNDKLDLTQNLYENNNKLNDSKYKMKKQN